jgi:rhodanese-related sulfurtransferase
MKAISIPFFFLIFSYSLACTSCADNDHKGKVSVTEFKAKLAAETNPQLIDVRTPEEFNQGNIEGALNLNFYASDFDAKLNALDKSKPVFLYCQSGIRSAKSYKLLKHKGFKEVYDLEKGYDAWTEN